MIELKGTPGALGRDYGKRCREGIAANLKTLVYRQGEPPLPRQDEDFKAWVHRQESLLEKCWPWLLEEMAGVAEGCEAKYEDILLLNLRAWQYDLYGRPPAGGCSSLAVTLADGTTACAGALDDPARFYCGPVRFMPDNCYAFITFPITGTGWANRGMNSAGLAIGISSQLLPGLRRLPHAVNQDLALRVMLQICATADEVREFCRVFPFTINLVCVDAGGGIFCAHQTAAGLFEQPVSDGWCALTNHVSDDAVIHQLTGLGVREFPESATTRARRGNLVDFCRRRSGVCTMEEVLELIGGRDDGNPGSIHNRSTICLTFSNPQADPGVMRVMQAEGSQKGKGFEVVKV